MAKKAKAVKTEVDLVSKSPLRGKASRTDFLTDVATQSIVPLDQVKKVLDGLRVTVARNLREKGSSRIPNMMSLKLKIYPARKEQIQVVFGKEKLVKERPTELRKIMMSALKPLKDAVK